MNLNIILNAIAIIIALIFISAIFGLSLVAGFNKGNLPCLGATLILIVAGICIMVFLFIQRKKQG